MLQDKKVASYGIYRDTEPPQEQVFGMAYVLE